MFNSRKRSNPLDIWPGFVDALATVLMVIIFVLMTFVVAQLYLTEALNHKEEHATSLEQKIYDLQKAVDEQQEANSKLREKSETLDQLIQELNQKLMMVGSELKNKENAVKETIHHNNSLQEETESLKKKIDHLLKSLMVYETTYEAAEKKIQSLLSKMNKSISSQLDSVINQKDHEKALLLEKRMLQEKIATLENEHADLTTKLEKTNGKNQFDHYRSEFFAHLLKILGNRPDIRIVGDRFVFQSEVLFDKASADLGTAGKAGLDALVKAIEELQHSIPSSLSWILRVDGHTDQRPINSSQFPSNWELSSARSIAVVKYLISKGIAPERLVAAGFGENQPLARGSNEADFARNRRIEFKLDQK